MAKEIRQRMRLINAGDVKKRADCYPPSVRVAVANILSHTKTVKDAVEVIRCRDCKHWHRELSEDGIEYINFSHCEKGLYGDGHNWFCADGERREDGKRWSDVGKSDTD